MTSALTRNLLTALIVWAAPLSGMEIYADDGTPWVSDFAGTWEVSPAANRLLGYSGAERDELNTTFEHPVSFTLAVDEELEQGVKPEMHPESKRQLFETFFKRHNQRLVATGEVKWKFEFQENRHGWDPYFFITHSEGSTFLWCGAPYVIFYGGKISLIRGRDRDHDLLVIDFNPVREMNRKLPVTQDTVVFQRAKQ
jgi:hypothetical protein